MSPCFGRNLSRVRVSAQSDTADASPCRTAALTSFTCNISKRLPFADGSHSANYRERVGAGWIRRRAVAAHHVNLFADPV